MSRFQVHMTDFAIRMAFGKYKICAVCFLLFCFVMTIAGCGESDTSEHFGSGVLSPSVTVDAGAVGVDGEVSLSLVDPLPTESDMKLRITNMQSGRVGEWPNVYDYPADEALLPGRYKVEAFFGDSITEGFGCPYFYAGMEVSLSSGAVLDVPLRAKLACSMLQVRFTDNFRNFFPAYKAVLHSMGGAYVDYPAEESDPVYMRPGNISVFLSVAMPATLNDVVFEAARINNAFPGYFYVATIDVSDAGGAPVVTVSFDSKVESDDVSLVLTPEFLAAEAPEIECEGFVSGQVLEWIEGVSTSGKYSMNVSSKNLKSLVLTTRCAELTRMGWPAGVDILDIADNRRETMVSLGLKIRDADDKITLDFSDVLPELRYMHDAPNTLFTLEAVASNMKSSEPAVFEVKSLPVALGVVSATDIVAGVNKGEIVVESPTDHLAGNLELAAFDGGKWTPLEIYEIESRGNSRYALRFMAPGGTDPVKLRVIYCGSVKAELILDRVSPKFTIAVDTYALKAVVKVLPEDPSLRSVITSMLRVYGNGVPLSVIDVDAEEGMLVLGSLSASTRYSFTATVFSSPSENDFCSPAVGYTENIETLENGSFEDREKTFEYKDMPSGGRYSQSIVEIFNQQNRRSFEVYTPEKWANTNGKTACVNVSNINTWYVEPSVYSVEDAYAGAYAVMIQSVGWDNNGEYIPDYLQPYGHYTKYSCNIPHISHRAAGRLFLGSYSYDSASGSEYYQSGKGFGSRPSALNGFYKFVPSSSDPSDRGVAVMEVIGVYKNMEIVIARSQLMLRPAMTYTAFSVPVTYNHFGVKATAIRVTFASSMHYGSIAEESVSVPVSPDPEISAALGSTLWIDEVSLSY